MRRFYAFILMAFSILAIVLFNVQSQGDLFNYGLEYASGSEITYKITPDDDVQNFNIQDVAKLFNDRLEQAGAKDYYVYAKNDETIADNSYTDPTYEITVRLSGLSTTTRNVNILRSVESCGTFWLTSLKDGEELRTSEGNDIVRGSATISYDGSSATVEVETTDEFKNDVASKLTQGTSSDDDDEDSESTSGDTIVIWSDYIDNEYSYEEANKDETIAQKEMQDKIIAVVDCANFSSDDNILSITAIGYVSSGTSTQTLNSSSAHSIQRMLNADELNYDIERICERTISPQYGVGSDKLVLYSCIIMVIVAVVILIEMYGINGVAGSVSIVLSSFVTVVLYNSFILSVTPAFVISFIASVTVSLVILTAYFSRFKNELYKGRSPSKANKEGFRGTISTAVDATVFTLITSIILAVLSKNTIQNFSLFLIIGVICNFLICLFLTRLMLYFICNSKIALNKKIFRVDESKIPNLAKEESQTYFSAHDNFDSTKHQKKSFISLLVLTCISIVSIVVFTFVGGNNSPFVYNSEFDSYTAIQILDAHGETFTQTEDVENFFAADDVLGQKPFEVNIVEVTDPNDINEEDTIYYIEAKFKLSISELDDASEAIQNKLRDEYNFDFVINGEEYTTYDSINYFEVVPHASSKNFTNAILMICITALCTIVYCFIRFRYTFALSSIVNIASTMLITTGILVLTRIPVSPNVGMALLAAVIIVTLFELIILERYGQYKKEQKNKVIVLDDRKKFASTALRRSIFSILVLFLTVLGGSIIMMIVSPSQMISLYITLLIGVSVGLLSTLFLFVPIYNYSEKHLAIKFKKKIKIRKNKDSKKANKAQHTSKEVEEIIIPGIND